MSESTQTLHINGETIKLYDNASDVGTNKLNVGSLFAKMDAKSNNNVNNSNANIGGNKILVRNFTTISTVPTQSGSLTYNGSARTPSWSNYNSTYLTISGSTSGTNAGTYTATFTPKYGYSWNNWTTTGKTSSWKIGQASGVCNPNTRSVGVASTQCQCTVGGYNGNCPLRECTDCSSYYYYYYDSGYYGSG